MTHIVVLPFTHNKSPAALSRAGLLSKSGKIEARLESERDLFNDRWQEKQVFLYKVRPDRRMIPAMTKGYPGDVRDTYLDGTVLGVVGGMLSVAMEGADQGIRAVSGREYEAPSGMFGRMQRDVSATINHLFSREFLKAGSAAWSAISGDVIMDIWDLLNGKHR